MSPASPPPEVDELRDAGWAPPGAVVDFPEFNDDGEKDEEQPKQELEQPGGAGGECSPCGEEEKLRQVPDEWRAVYQGDPFQAWSLLPVVMWVPSYIRAARGASTNDDLKAMGALPYSLRGDVIAGLTVGCMLTPQCLAFAMLAGLPVRVGLYSSFMPLVVYLLLGTLRELQVGPTALMSLLTGQALDAAGYMAEGERIAGAGLLAALVGAFSLLLGVLRFGFVVDLMSHSVVAAFCTAAGVTIASTQVKDMLGITIPRSEFWWQTVHSIAENLPHSDPPTIALGFTLLAILMSLKSWKTAGSAEKRSKHPVWRFLPRHKEGRAFRALKFLADMSSLVSVVLGWIWGYLYRQAGVHSVRLIGDAKSDGFLFAAPGAEIAGNIKWAGLTVSALLMCLVGFLETAAVGGKLAAEKRYAYEPNQELIALGLANGACAVMSGYPITGSFTRTAVNAMFGATSQLAGGISALVVLLAVYALLPVVEKLPRAALAPLIIQGALGVTSLRAFKSTWHADKVDFLVMAATFLTSMAITVKEGLIAGFALSMARLLYQVAMPDMSVCGRTEDGSFKDIRRHPKAEMLAGSVVVHMDAGLSFVNSRRFKEFCLRAAAAGKRSGKGCEYLIVDCKSLSSVDTTGAETLEALGEALHKCGQSLLLADVRGPVAERLSAAGLDEHLQGDCCRICRSMGEALEVVGRLGPRAAWKSA